MIIPYRIFIGPIRNNLLSVEIAKIAIPNQSQKQVIEWYHSGTSASFIHNSFLCTNKFNTRNTSANKWSTMAWSFLTSCEAEIKIKLPELHFTAQIFAPFHITSRKSNYNIIFGRDLLQEIGINLDFQNNFVDWKETKTPMKSIDCKMRTNFAIQGSKNIESATYWIKKI